MDRLEPTFEEFLGDLRRTLGENLADIVIHGSYALGDFRPGFGDLDYMVVTHVDLEERTNERIFAMHDRYRSEKRMLLHQLEGTFFPARIAQQPGAAFVGCYIGTTRRGWRTITTLPSSFIDLAVARRYGRHLLEPPVPIYCPTADEILEEQKNDQRKLLAAMNPDSRPDFGLWISAIHWSARTIYYLDAAEITSKGKACLRCRDNPGLHDYAELFRTAEDRRYPYGDEPLARRQIEGCRRLLEHIGQRLAREQVRGSEER
ncbi:MAG: nucleotidyltransferase domain-containing protein [Candidatus Fermentibacter sp.]|nr:nucleotidyltransferase domain-containing protein [Candidatus Fermentibacter sp.]